MTAGTTPSRAPSRRPVSAGEQELWLLERERPEDPAYLVPFAVWVDGPVDGPALQTALTGLVARHETLRTVIRTVAGGPVAEVLPPSAVRCPVTEADSETGALATARDEARRPFAGSGTRLRARLVRVVGGRSLLLLVLHHTVCDAASLWILLAELVAGYEAALAGRPLELPPAVPLPASGAPGEIDPGVLEQQAHAVAEHVRSAPDLIDLPFDRVDTDATTVGDGVNVPPPGRLLQVPVPARVNEAVDRLARRLEVSPNAVLLAAYGVLLDVVAGAEDVLVSMPVSQRMSPARQRVVGYLVHSVPVRLRTADHSTVEALIRHAWSALTFAWSHSGVSFGRVVAEVNPRRVPGLNPLCQCEFSVQTLPDELPTLDGAPLSYQFVHNGGHKFSLSLELVRSGPRRSLALEYPAALFTTGTVRRLANLYLRILGALVADSDARPADLDLVSTAERAWLAEHDGTGDEEAAARRPMPVPLAERIGTALRDRAGELAVVAPDRSLTYGELRCAADDLADRLRAAGVVAGERVIIQGERSAASVVAVVACVRLGAAFVCVADDVPSARLSHIMAAAAPAALVVAGRGPQQGLPAHLRATARPWEGGLLVGRNDGLSHPARTPDPGEAYVVFTSGSTGTPRGVSVPSVAIATITAAWGQVFGLEGHPPTHLQLAPISFDVFVGDLARTLGFGGTLVIASRADILAPGRLAALISRERVDTVEFVPAVARLLVDYLQHVGAGLPTLRRVMVGSDTWHVADARRLRALLPAAASLHCTYGTSETAVDSTYFPVPEADGDREITDVGGEAGAGQRSGVTPIGLPFPGVLVSVRDRLGRLIPPRCAGELWIGGDTVADGYLSAPPAARERFLEQPGDHGRRVRWYRTGDRATWDGGGFLHLLGRMDSETKISGVRVHPGEVEAVLLTAAAVGSAAVVATGQGQQRGLTAFVTGPVDVEDVTAHARRYLIPAAVPTRFTVLERLPVTRHGKVDYAALAALAAAPAHSDEPDAPPEGASERIVADVSQEVLGMPGLGVLDDFFAVGGTSIQLAVLTWRVSVATGTPLELPDVLSGRSIPGLARLVEARRSRSGPGPVAGSPAGSPAGSVPWPVPDTPPLSAARPAPSPARDVVLTGATGELGAGILTELLLGPVDSVRCVVRAGSGPEARERVRHALTLRGADPRSADDPRIRWLPADLAAAEAGLSASVREEVARADAIVNAAAWVNFLYPHHVLAPVNVDAVAVLARLAGHDRLSPLHQVSTRTAAPTDGRLPEGGYNTTKAAAEVLLERCHRRGLPVSLYRPGFVLGRPSPRPGLLESFLRDCLRLGLVPDLPGHLDVVSTRYVASRIVTNVLSPTPHAYPDLTGAGPVPWAHAWDALRAQGFRLRTVAPATWLDTVAFGARPGPAPFWFEPFLPLAAAVGLPGLLCDGPGAGHDDEQAEPVAELWGRVARSLADPDDGGRTGG